MMTEKEKILSREIDSLETQIAMLKRKLQIAENFNYRYYIENQELKYYIHQMEHPYDEAI